MEGTSKMRGLESQLSEIRIVMIGGRELGGIEASGKSSTGNTILGEEVFEVGRRTARCLRRDGQVFGRHVTVVDTPGWWWNYSVKNTPQFDQLEIRRSLSLCHPGPHAFLLVIPVNNIFPDIYRTALKEQLEFLGEGVWRHTIVLFSSIAPHDENVFKVHISRWQSLQWLLRRCKNRYHVLDNKDRGDGSQVSVLLDKIEEMMAEESSLHYPVIANVSAALDKRKRDIEKRALQRMADIQQQTLIHQDHGIQTEIRIVILGASWSARSSTGNTIMGKDALEVNDASRTTVRCEVTHANVQGRHVTVVDSPGWFYSSPLKQTAQMDKLEILCSVSMCPPGPHAILLTVPFATAFHEIYRQAVEEHMGLLGEKVWSHTIVVFTRGDWIGDTSVEERIECEGDDLKWLIDRCGNRYHVLNNKVQGDVIQISELFDKIDSMMARNNCCHFQMDFSGQNERLRLIEKQAAKNKMIIHRQRGTLREFFKETNFKLSEVNVVLLGKEKVGKSGTGNCILSGAFFEEALIAEFRTQTSTQQCTAKKRKIAGRLVTVVDTPRWSKENSEEILRSVSMCPPGPHAFLLVIPAALPFTKKDQAAVEKQMELFGETVWKHTLLLFSRGGWLGGRPIEEHIECEGEALKWLVEKCGNRYHVLDSCNWGNGIQVRSLLEKIEELVVRNRGDHYTTARKKRQKMVLPWLSGAGTMTEEEWQKREDDFIERMLRAVVVDLKTDESPLPTRRKGSFDIAYIPSMSGETFSEVASVAGSFEPVTQNLRVAEWLGTRCHGQYVASSGYSTMSSAASVDEVETASTIQKQAPDIEKPIVSHLAAEPMAIWRNTRKPILHRTNSI